MFSLIVWSRGFDKNWGDDGGEIGEEGEGVVGDDGHNGGEEGDGVGGSEIGVQVREKHCPVKFVIPVEVLEFKVVDNVKSVIEIVTDVYGLAVSRYFSPAVYMINPKELKVPHMDSLVSPE
jgi:hypothetical protein